MEKRQLSQLQETAIVAARMAGQHALELMSYAKGRVKENNGYRELVTQADPQCQKIIIDRIKETYPDHGFIAEEGREDKLFKQPPRGDEEIWWAIDPIDGTNNYAHQLPIFAVSIAAMHEGRPVAAAIFDPATESMFTAVLDGNAQLNSRRINASDEKMCEFSTIGIDSHFDWRGHDAEWTLKMMTQTRFRDIGSTALQFSYVAKGSFIATVQPGPKLWDIAAGTLIVERAGGKVTDFQGNPVFPLNLEEYSGRKFKTVASNASAHPAILNLINQ